MSGFVKKLENYEDLEVSIIRATKINKVLKALVKLNSIPRDEEFNFRKRSVDLLGKWNEIIRLADSNEGEASTAAEKDSKSTPTTNGVHEEASGDKKEDIASTAEPDIKPAEVMDKVAQIDATGIEPVQVESKQPTVEESTPAAQPKPVEPTADSSVEKLPEPAVLDKAPESAAAASEATEMVKATE